MREHNKEYRLIAQRRIRSEPQLSFIQDYGIKVAYLSCDKPKNTNHKKVLADCMKVPEQWRWTCKYDFVITVYEPNCTFLSEEQKDILVFHELMHIGVDEDGDEPKFYVKPHDVEEFNEIINRYGLYWDEVGDN